MSALLEVEPSSDHDGVNEIEQAAIATAGSETASDSPSLLRSARRWLSAKVRPLLDGAARNYIAGETVADAMRVARLMQRRSLSTTLGYWDASGESPDDVLGHYLDALQAIEGSGLDTYLSIKLPSLDYDQESVEALLDRASSVSTRIHFDALSHDSVDRTWSLIEQIAGYRHRIRCTLPGRWLRSVADADWVVKQQLPVRVVKGQFADPNDPERDRRTGYLEVIASLAGRARHVSVATHDLPLLKTSLQLLRDTGTSCDVEALYGLSWRSAVGMARRFGVPARLYIPYGAAYLPYCLKEARRSPGLLCRAMVDTAKGLFSRF